MLPNFIKQFYAMADTSIFKVKQWEAWIWPMTFTDASGDDLDVSWATIYFTVRKRTDLHDDDDADVLIKKTIANENFLFALLFISSTY